MTTPQPGPYPENRRARGIDEVDFETEEPLFVHITLLMWDKISFTDLGEFLHTISSTMMDDRDRSMIGRTLERHETHGFGITLGEGQLLPVIVRGSDPDPDSTDRMRLLVEAAEQAEAFRIDLRDASPSDLAGED